MTYQAKFLAKVLVGNTLETRDFGQSGTYDVSDLVEAYFGKGEEIPAAFSLSKNMPYWTRNAPDFIKAWDGPFVIDVTRMPISTEVNEAEPAITNVGAPVPDDGLACLADLVGVLLRTGKSIDDAVYAEGISDAYTENLRSALSILKNRGKLSEMNLTYGCEAAVERVLSQE